MSRVAYLCADPGIAVFGTKGASVHVQEIVRAFRRRGDDVTVYATRRGEEVPGDLADLEVVVVPVGRGDAATREQQVAQAALRLADVATASEPDLIYERYALFSRAGATVHERTGAPLVVEVNAPLIDEQREHRVLVDAASALEATEATLRAARTISCVSPPVAAWVRAICPDVDPRVVGNGVNTERITPHREAGRPFTVGFVGTLKPWHGTDLLLRAVAEGDPAWRLAICGDGPERAALAQLAIDLGVDGRTTFTGALAPERIPDFLAGIDVGVAPYPPASAADHYFSPLKVYEYLAAGVPVVASALGTLPSIVEHRRTGLLVEPGDVAGLTEALRTLADEPDLRHAMGRAARAEAEAEHDWSAVLDRTLSPGLAGVAR